jgi:hypothetical protein
MRAILACALLVPALALALPDAGRADARYTCEMNRFCVNTDPCLTFESAATYELTGDTDYGDRGTGHVIDDGGDPGPAITFSYDHDRTIIIEWQAEDRAGFSRLFIDRETGLAVESLYVPDTRMLAVQYGRCRGS